MQMFEDPGVQRLLGTGLTAALGGPGRGREVAAFTKRMDLADQLRIDREKMQAEQLDRDRQHAREETKLTLDKIKTAGDMISHGASPQFAFSGTDLNNPAHQEMAQSIAINQEEKRRAEDYFVVTDKNSPGFGQMAQGKGGPGTLNFKGSAQALAFKKHLDEHNKGIETPLSNLYQQQDRLIDQLSSKLINGIPMTEGQVAQTQKNLGYTNRALENMLNDTWQKYLNIAYPVTDDMTDDEKEAVYRKRQAITLQKVINDANPSGMRKTVEVIGNDIIFTEEPADSPAPDFRGKREIIADEQAAKESRERQDNATGVLYNAFKMIDNLDESVIGAAGWLRGVFTATTEQKQGLMKLFGSSTPEEAHQEYLAMIEDSKQDLASSFDANSRLAVPEGDRVTLKGDWLKDIGLSNKEGGWANPDTWFDPRTSIINSLTIALATKLAGMVEPGKLTDDDINRQIRRIYGGNTVLPSVRGMQVGLKTIIKEAEKAIVLHNPRIKRFFRDEKDIPTLMAHTFRRSINDPYPGERPFWLFDPGKLDPMYEKYKKYIVRTDADEHFDRETGAPMITLKGEDGKLYPLPQKDLDYFMKQGWKDSVTGKRIRAIEVY